MKKIVSLFLLGTLVFAGCKKEHIPGSPSVKLSLTSFYNNGSEETRIDKTGKIEKNSSAELINDGTGEKFLVNLGTMGGSLFGISFLFENKTQAAAIPGTYTFPQSQLLLRVTLRNDVAINGTEVLSLPYRGKVSFTYDSNLQKISGNIDELEFNTLSNDPYGRYRVTVKGSFKDIPVR